MEIQFSCLNHISKFLLKTSPPGRKQAIICKVLRDPNTRATAGTLGHQRNSWIYLNFTCFPTKVFFLLQDHRRHTALLFSPVTWISSFPPRSLQLSQLWGLTAICFSLFPSRRQTPQTENTSLHPRVPLSENTLWKTHFFLKIYIFLCVQVFCLQVCMCFTRVQCLRRPELELQIGVSYHVGTCGDWELHHGPHSHPSSPV